MLSHFRDREAVQFFPVGESLTKQDGAEESDINVIMRKYQAGAMPPYAVVAPLFGDFTSGADFLETSQRLVDAQVAFESLPADVRDAVGNDPARLLDLFADPSKRAKLEELGLVAKVADQEAAKTAAAAAEEALAVAGTERLAKAIAAAIKPG